MNTTSANTSSLSLGSPMHEKIKQFDQDEVDTGETNDRTIESGSSDIDDSQQSHNNNNNKSNPESSEAMMKNPRNASSNARDIQCERFAPRG